MPKDSANLAEPLAFNAKRRTPARDASLLTFSISDNAYRNVLPDSSMSSVIANPALKIIVTLADLKTEITVSTARILSSLLKDTVFLNALKVDSETDLDAESAILHVLLVLREARALLASLNSLSTKDSVLPNANQAKSLLKTLVSLVKILTA